MVGSISLGAADQIPYRFDPQQEGIVEYLKQCPDLAAMRGLVLSFRSVLHLGKLVRLHSRMKRAQNSGVHAVTRLVQALEQDVGALEAAVTEPRSHVPVEGCMSRLKTLKRQICGRARVELFRARLRPDTFVTHRALHQT